MQAAKINAFLRYGMAIAWSRKLALLSKYVSRILEIVFYFYLDRLLFHAGLREVEGGTYFTFLLIGGVFVRYLDAVMRAFSDSLREQVLVGATEPILATPNRLSLSLLGPSFWTLIEDTVLLLAQFLIGSLVGADFSQANWLSVSMILLVSLLCVLSIGVLVAAFTVRFKRSDPLQWLSRTVTQVFSGVFFPVSVFPPALRVVSYVLPFTYAIQGLRKALMQGGSLAALAPELLVLAGFSVVLMPVSLWLLHASVRHVKRTGALLHY